MSHQKIKTAIYAIEYSNLNPENVGFAIHTIKEINNRLNQLNQSLTKTYYLEEEILMHGLFPREMIVSVRENAAYRLIKGSDIINYIGYDCNNLNEEVRDKVKKLSDMSLVKAYEFTREYADWNGFFKNLCNYLKYQLENNGYTNLKNLSAYNFGDDSRLKIAANYDNQ